jgi:cysteine desulfurase
MHSLYFDHAATTRPHASVVACVLETLEDNFANPSSLHRQGLFAERLVEEARVTLAEALFCDEDEIVFTSGGTEDSENAAPWHPCPA